MKRKKNPKNIEKIGLKVNSFNKCGRSGAEEKTD